MNSSKPNIIIVQGFGYSGSSAVAEFLSVCSGQSKAYIAESILLKSFFQLAYSYYTNNELTGKRRITVEKNFLALAEKEDTYSDESEWRDARALLEKAKINYNEYFEFSTEILKLFDNVKKIINENDRKKEIVKISTKYFVYISSKIEANLGVCIYDNLINAHLLKWLQVLDLNEFNTVSVYAVYRKNLRDQFVEQIENSMHHGKNIKSNIKNTFLYFLVKTRNLIPSKKRTLGSGIGLLPIGVHGLLNKFSMKLFWLLFLKDLKKRILIYQEDQTILKQDCITYNKLLCFEDFVGNDDKYRKELFNNLCKIQNKSLKENVIFDFKHQDSQKNINKYKKYKYGSTLDVYIPNEIEQLVSIEALRKKL